MSGEDRVGGVRADAGRGGATRDRRDGRSGSRLNVDLAFSLGPDLTVDPEAPIFVISVAAQLAGMHPQTLRQYDRLGLVRPGRTRGRGRRYSARDVALLREVQRLSQEEGVNLAGIKRILELELEVGALREQVRQLTGELQEIAERERARSRVFAAGPHGDIVAMPTGRRPQRPSTSGALVVWRPPHRR